MNLKIQTISVGRHTVITKDNVNLSIQASIAFRVVNPIVAHYVLGYQINNALIELTISSLRNVVGSFNLDEVLRGRVEVTKATIKEITIGLPQGISVERIFMEEISVPKNIESDLSSAARQRRLA